MSPLNKSLEKIKEVAVSAAKAAGGIQLAHYGGPRCISRSFAHDLKIEVDRLCEQAMIETIKNDFPDHSIITEEGGGRQQRSPFVWILDPLDGTVNFCHGIPYFSASVACYRHVQIIGDPVNDSPAGLSALGEPLVGVVYAPLVDELFLGVKGYPASCNGQTIETGNNERLREAVICMSYGSDDGTMRRMEKLNALLLRKVRKVRVLGSTCLDIVNVACGRLSGLLQGSVRNWDFAAARVVLEQSGGIFHAKETSSNRWEIMACAPGLDGPLNELTGEIWKTSSG